MAPSILLEKPAHERISNPRATKANGTEPLANGTLRVPLSNPSLQTTADHQLKQVDAPVYAPKRGEVLLHIKATGVCGIPENVSFAEGALLEPLSVVMHGISSTRLGLGRAALICGAGPIGLIALAAARASGAHPLVITDLEPRRLAFAKEFVPGCMTYQVDRSLDAEGNARAIRKLFGQDEYSAPQTVLECTGVESSICTAAFTVRRGGTVMVIGVGRPVMNNLPFMHMSLAEIP
ncbi:hypothetical protein H2199_001705 [Coniosporium tulheliwenetii]|uniref:Uncharacterized protein n=1 Tax=Coniosporium tulheliwenetii TaxID=3383036 RepID=A0ACC2ZK39_9PEZI|nr:hypothetical protein H2199_001705 [Cladosporium sp. JES 115]